jgi:hypothetical protein
LMLGEGLGQRKAQGSLGIRQVSKRCQHFVSADGARF